MVPSLVTYLLGDGLSVKGTAADWKSGLSENTAAGAMATCTRRKLRAKATAVGN